MGNDGTTWQLCLRWTGRGLLSDWPAAHPSETVVTLTSTHDTQFSTGDILLPHREQTHRPHRLVCTG